MKKFDKQKASMADLAIAAMYEAAKEVIRRAKETNTPIIICKDGKIKRVPANDFRLPPKQSYVNQSLPREPK